MGEPIYYYSETENGSPVQIKVTINGNFTAWRGPTRREIVFVDKLNNIDFELINNLKLPNWNFDYTGRGLVLEKGKLDWGVTKTQLESLKIKTPYRNTKNQK